MTCTQQFFFVLNHFRTSYFFANKSEIFLYEMAIDLVVFCLFVYSFLVRSPTLENWQIMIGAKVQICWFKTFFSETWLSRLNNFASTELPRMWYFDDFSVFAGFRFRPFFLHQKRFIYFIVRFFQQKHVLCRCWSH